jgi:hypothetical protein
MIFRRDQPDDRMPHVFRALAARANVIVTPRRLGLRAEPAKPICQCFHLSRSPARCSIRSERPPIAHINLRWVRADWRGRSLAHGKSHRQRDHVPQTPQTGWEQEEILLPACGINARPQMFQRKRGNCEKSEIISSMSTSEVCLFGVLDQLSVVSFPLSRTMPQPE